MRNSPYKGNASFAQVLDLAEGARAEDAGGYRAEFIELVNRAKALRGG
ncbi:MAG: YfbK domain-containing protein [Myxococcota bacterium]